MAGQVAKPSLSNVSFSPWRLTHPTRRAGLPTISAKAGSNGKLFGSVTSKEIAAEIKKVLGIEIDKKKMSVADIKNFGEYTAEIKLYQGISAKITVKVTE